MGKFNQQEYSGWGSIVSQTFEDCIDYIWLWVLEYGGYGMVK